MSAAYTDDDVQDMAIALHIEDYGRWASGPDPDGTPWGTSREQDRRASYEASARAVLDAVAPAIAARALREAARDRRELLLCAPDADALDRRADEIERTP
jgi:hypothetical protein